MVEHIVLFKVGSEVAGDRATRMLGEIVSLKNKITGVVSATAGVNFSQRSQGYTHGLVMRFRDRAALDAYLSHPLHQAVVKEHIEPICPERVVVDYDISEI